MPLTEAHLRSNILFEARFPMELALEVVLWVNILLDEAGVAPFAILAGCYRWLFGKARRFSPGSGLAIGYYDNFLGPVLRSVRARSGPSEVLLWMPPVPDGPASRSRFDDMVTGKDVGAREYVNHPLDTDQGKRTILMAEHEGRQIGLDLPRTLTPVLSKLIELPAGRLLRRLGTADATQRRELRNFWEALIDRIRHDNLETRVRIFHGDPAFAYTEARALSEWKALFDQVIPKPHALLRIIGF